MIIEYIRYEMPSGESQEGLVAAYAEAGQSLQLSPYCLGYEMTQCGEDTACFTLRIQWDSAAGHLEGFRHSREFREFYRAVAPFVANIKEMRHYRAAPVQWQR